MNPWPRLIGRLLFVFVWLLFISLPVFAFVLAAHQQIQIGSDDRSHLRIFLLQQKDVEGIGLEFAREAPTNSPCMQTSVRYFMWTGDEENVTFCLCHDPLTKENLPAEVGICSPP